MLNTLLHAAADASLLDVLLDTLLDTAKTVPLLYLVYLLMEWLEGRMNAGKIQESKIGAVGPAFGALLGCVPQCGFSAACATLYNGGVIGAGTLIAVFISTSDEAIPILISHFSDMWSIVLLIAVKVVIAIGAGYLLRYTVFRNEVVKIPAEHPVELEDHPEGSCCHHHKSIFVTALEHTVKISLFILATLLIINLIFFLVGEERVESLLLSGSILQPTLAAVIGLVPGCATSVLITELYIGGTLSFGSAVAGLVTGAGFGYILLLRGQKNKKPAVKIILCILAVGIVSGTLIHLLPL